MKKILTRKKAFSLIELSIVILIVGVVIAGVTQSSRMINAFRLQTARNLTQNSPVASMKNVLMWFETTSSASFTESEADNGLSITTWNDINPTSTFKYSATSSGSNRPVYIANCRNSLPCLRFTAANSSYFNITPEYLFTQYLTVFLVCTPSSAAGYIFATNDGGGAPAIISKYNPGSGVKDFEWFLGGERSTFNTSGASGLNIINLVRDNLTGSGGVFKGYFNGAQAFSISTTDTVIGRSFNYIARSDATTDYYGGDIVELIVFDRTITAEERDSVKNYLSKKWGIVVS